MILARNHALVDGNKRLAWAATRVFCLLDGSGLVSLSMRRRRSSRPSPEKSSRASEIAAVTEEHLR